MNVRETVKLFVKALSARGWQVRLEPQPGGYHITWLSPAGAEMAVYVKTLQRSAAFARACSWLAGKVAEFKAWQQAFERLEGAA